MTSGPADIDVIVPVHTTARPVARAVASALDGTRARVRVLVVCHDVEPTLIRDAIGADPRVELLSHRDGVRSPAGPLNAGLRAVEAQYFAKLDSDDTLQTGALDTWLEIARRREAEIVMPRMLWPGAIPTPPLRPRRRALVDPLADRLAYRTSTMGLIARRLAGAAAATEGLVTGEDIAPSLRLWFSGARIAWAGNAPAYIVHDDGDERATARRRIADTLAFVPSVVDDDDLRAKPDPQRAAMAAKLLRVHVFGAIAAQRGGWTTSERALLAGAVRQLGRFGDGAGALSRADLRLLTLAASESSSSDELGRAAAARRRRLHPRTLLPARWTGWMRPDGAGRIDVAFAFAVTTRRIATRSSSR